MNSYIRVRLFQVPSHKEEEISQLSFQFSANGISEALTYSQPDLTYEPDILPLRTHDIDVFFDEAPPEKFFQTLQELLPSIRWQISEEEHQDWLEEWKKGFVPFQLSGPFWVVPTWCQSPTSEAHTIVIDPGMAFGTGTHATTKMAAYFVQKCCSQIAAPQTLSMIDVGTGTGILAMLAKKNNIGKVVGIEIDPDARRVARENRDQNHLTIEIPDLLIEEINEKFDLVVANIIDGILVQIKDALLKTMKKNGDLFLTGILLERESYFQQNFIEQSGLRVMRRLEKDEWVGYWLKA